MNFMVHAMRSHYGYNLLMEIISRAEAMALGLKRYFTGKQCPHGHTAERFVSTFACVDCLKTKTKEYGASPEGQARRLERDRENREHIQQRRKSWDSENRGKINARSKAWNQANPEKYKAIVKKSRLKKATDERHIISKRMSDRLRWSLKSGKDGKSWRELVDYSVAELAQHLEKQFKPGMTWENIGQWHIDHIVPIVDFAFTKPSDPEFKACWSLGNLRPAWASVNKTKGDKRLFLL
jgi:hypothetical protein